MSYDTVAYGKKRRQMTAFFGQRTFFEPTMKLAGASNRILNPMTTLDTLPFKMCFDRRPGTLTPISTGPIQHRHASALPTAKRGVRWTQAGTLAPLVLASVSRFVTHWLISQQSFLHQTLMLLDTLSRDRKLVLRAFDRSTA